MGEELTGGAPAQKRAGLSVHHMLQAVLGVVLAFSLIYWGMPWIGKTSWSAIGDQVERYSVGHMLIFAALCLLSIFWYSFLFTGSLPGLSHWRGMTLNACASAVSNSLPGGGFLTVVVIFLLSRSWGYSKTQANSSILVVSAWSFLARISLPAIAMIWLVVERESMPGRVVPFLILGAAMGAFVGISMFLWLAYEKPALWLTHTFAPLLHKLRVVESGERGDHERAVLALRDRMRVTVADRGVTMALSQVLFFATHFAIFWGCLRVLGVGVPLVWQFAAFAVGRLMTVLPLTPGDVGLTETFSLLILVTAGADSSASAAAVLVYTLFGSQLVTPLGIIAGLIWWVRRGDRGAA